MHYIYSHKDSHCLPIQKKALTPCNTTSPSIHLWPMHCPLSSRKGESFCTSVITDITNTTTTDIPSLSSNISMTCFCRARRLPYNLICIYPPYSKLKHSQVRVSSSVICIEMYKYVYIRVSICQKFTLQLMHVY